MLETERLFATFHERVTKLLHVVQCALEPQPFLTSWVVSHILSGKELKCKHPSVIEPDKFTCSLHNYKLSLGIWYPMTLYRKPCSN